MEKKAPNSPHPLVSVCIATYQHERYIEACLKSALAQLTAFEFEIIIGEDGSSDGTRAICKRFAREHPDRIKLVLQDRANVIYFDGKPTGRYNILDLFKRSRGKYIALLEGDDLWTDTGKLQLQVDLLEANTDAALCFTNAFNLRNGQKEDYMHAWLKKDTLPDTFCTNDIITSNFIPTATMLFRKRAIENIPEVFYRAPGLDWVLNIHLSQHGKLAYIDRPTAIRRIHSGGVISSKDRLTKLQWNLVLLEMIDRMTEGAFRQTIRERSKALCASAIQVAISQKDIRLKAFLQLAKELGLKVGLRSRLRAKFSKLRSE